MNQELDNKVCEYCVWYSVKYQPFHNRDIASKVCKKHSPISLQGLSVFPVMSKDDWCGDFEANVEWFKLKKLL